VSGHDCETGVWQGFLCTNEGKCFRINGPNGSWLTSGISNRAANGSVQIAGTSGSRAVRCTCNTGSGVYSFISLGCIKSFRGDSTSSASAINSIGQVTGFSIAGNFKYHAFRYADGSGMKDLGTLGGDQSYGYGINSRGDVVGMSGISGLNDYHGFLYTDKTGMLDLTAAVVDLPPAESAARLAPSQINDIASVVSGLIRYADATTQAFVLTPVPQQ
jgi:probable HAF family extracellular repeat protein